MSESASGVQVVRGEMQPWTDRTTPRPALAALLTDVVPANRRTLILGPHAPQLIESVLAHSSDVTILVRSVADAGQLGEDFGPCLQVIAGALDGLQTEPYDVIIATDGLDRVLGYDSADLSWTERLAALAALAAPDAVVVLGLENEFSLLNLLDSRPADERHGDDEWRPLHDDPTRPVSVEQLRSALPWASEVYADFGSRTFVRADVAATSRPGELATRLAGAALETVDVPLLSPAAEGVDTAARADLLAAIPTGWLAIVGAQPPHDLYTQAATTTLTATQTLTGWDTTTPADATPASVGSLSFDPSVVPATIPSGVSVESVLFRLASAEDVPAFRKLAAELGEWVTTSRVIVRWDDVIYDGDSFAFGVSGWVAEDSVEKEDLLAAAWARFHDRLIGQHRRHPWPPWMLGDDLISAWLGMSGVEAPEQTQATSPDSPPATTEQVACGKEFAAALDAALESTTTKVDVRTALAEAEEAKQELFELKGHVYGLERTLGFRNKAMKTRENRIRELRGQLQRLTTAHERIRGSRTYAVSRVIFHAAQVRKPKVVARKLARRIRKR
ncbi:hypothetical protein [Kribbella sindirgiensis]|uniref:Class I SAM-dependent methyltransferase n=1 Tax=Kribbella sindirgiensis TaxID=1124744 RepID=A0A4R0ID41_9ACTN|nr:hypothetical protein [Kribbella sindirgiensis]TCC29830.1 hypothetical protein E0H50_25640 [Kribbella sindirgiensis]